MSVTVTIHNGEMGQIKHFIDEKNKKGQLYGLWTHSNQPVIQYVTGGVKEHEKEKIRSYLLNNHGLKQVGYWSTGKFGKESTLSMFKFTSVILPLWRKMRTTDTQ